MTKASLARRLRKAERATPLPEGVIVQDVLETGRRGVKTDTAVLFSHPEGADPVQCERAVFKRLQAVGRAMGKSASSPRRIDRDTLPTVDEE
jgi:hypothetical protein